MFKLLDKFTENWNRRIRKSQWFFVFSIGGTVAFVLVVVWLLYMLASFLVQTTYFSSFSLYDIWAVLCSIPMFLVLVIEIAQTIHDFKEKKRAKEKLANRTIPDYVEKYQWYVNLVQMQAQRSKYQTITLDEEWVKRFDQNLLGLAKFLTRTNFYFTDFNIASCLMYVLTSNKCKGENLYEFVLDCAKAIIAKPKVYEQSYGNGGELVLTFREDYKSTADFSVPDTEVPEKSTLAIIKTYLSQRDNFFDMVQLSSFLGILFIRSSRK